MAPRIEPGTEWVLRRGDHSGTVVQIEGQSFAGSVKYRVVRSGDSRDKVDEHDGRVHTVPQAQFLALYERNYKVHGVPGRPAFRQNNQMRRGRKAAQMELEPVAPEKSVPNGHYVNPGETGLSISVEMVTPDMAQAWLDRGGINRKPSERAISKLVMAIQAGEWDLTGETIKLDRDGKVRDGQHRLHAIIRSGIAVPVLVVRGISESAFDKIDTGKSRSMSDVLAIHGHTNTVALATAARGLIIIERYGRLEAGGVKLGYKAPPSHAQGVAYIDAHPEVIQAMHLADTLRKEGRFIGGTGLWTIVLTLFWRISPEQTRVFVSSLIEGANLETGSPILRLRNMYKGTARDWASNNESRERLLATVIKGWNAWRRDELVQALSWHNTGRSAEKFPVPE